MSKNNGKARKAWRKERAEIVHRMSDTRRTMIRDIHTLRAQGDAYSITLSEDLGAETLMHFSELNRMPKPGTDSE